MRWFWIDRYTEFDLDYIAKRARQSPCQLALSNRFGFGGQDLFLPASQFSP
jgi:3-oxoacyl-(acyl-carrier-protein) synthase